MRTTKTIVCLANSRRRIKSADRYASGLCFAGKEVLARGEYGKWVRPLNQGAERTLREKQQKFHSGKIPKLLDKVVIHGLQHAPTPPHNENHLISTGQEWEPFGTVLFTDLPKLVDVPKTLWQNGDSRNTSSNIGVNDRVCASHAKSFDASLFLIKPDKFAYVAVRNYFGKQKVRAEFEYRNVTYNLSVTDPVFEKKCLPSPNKLLGRPQSLADNNLYLCISLAEEMNGHCYKLVAGVIQDAKKKSKKSKNK